MRLQKVPRAFLSALELKSDGVAPPQFEDAVRGNIDMRAFYTVDRFGLERASGNIGATAGQILFLQVPQGRYWAVQSASMLLQAPAADSNSYQVGIAYLTTADPFRVYVAQSIEAVARGTAVDRAYIATWEPSSFFLLPPGASVLGVNLLARANQPCSLVVARYEFEA